jgi:hypothetical protein
VPLKSARGHSRRAHVSFDPLRTKAHVAAPSDRYTRPDLAAGVDGVDDLGVVDALEVDRGDPEVGVPELALDDDQRHALAGHLDGVRVADLVRREAAPHGGVAGDASQLGAGRGGRPSSNQAAERERSDWIRSKSPAVAAGRGQAPGYRSTPYHVGVGTRVASSRTGWRSSPQ